MSVTFNQPVRINKYNNPTNNGVIAPDNSGAVSASQQVQFTTTPSAGTITTYGIGASSATATTITLPAGSIVTNFKFLETSAPSAITGGVISIAIGSTTVGTITPTTSNGIVAFSAAAGTELAKGESITTQIAHVSIKTTAPGTVSGCE